MTCEDCALNRESEQAQLDAIQVSQIQMAEQVQWMVETINGLRLGFEEMMKNGGPLAMIKMLRSK